MILRATLLGLPLLLSGCTLFGGYAQLPAMMEACETNTGRVCGTWILQDGAYQARWSDGALGTVRVMRLDHDSIVLVRDDQAGVSKGMHAVYRGARSRHGASGLVEWNQNGASWSGRWEAEWSGQWRWTEVAPLAPLPPLIPRAPEAAPAAALPPSIRECETNTAQVCGEWSLEGGGYQARWSQGSVAEIQVLRFERDEIAFSRLDPSGTSEGMRAEYRGRMTGEHSAAGTVVWRRNGEVARGSWEATWPAPVFRRMDPPRVLRECETNTARVCGTWRARGDGYAAVWPQGSVAQIRVIRFDAEAIVMERIDTSGSSRGMRAVYRGRLSSGRSASGVVTWEHQGLSYSGVWDAEW
jgi:hypothetical protein